MKTQKGFSLIEVLMVFGILATLATVTVLILNPVEHLKSARDANRFSDLRSVQKTISLLKIGNPSLSFGSSSVVYVSLPDATSTCTSWDLPPLPVGWSYFCKDEANYKKVNGSGWIPVDLTVSGFGSSLSALPIDTQNNASDYFYYVYDPPTGTYELGTVLESNKNQIYAINDGGDSSTFWELGTNLALYPTTSVYSLVKNESDQQVYNDENRKMYAYAASVGQVSFFIEPTKITGDNDFFWNNSTKYLGIGTAGPSYKLDVQGVGQDGQINTSGGLCINGVCKTDWNIPWATLTSFPSACSSGQYVSAVGSSLTCSAPAVGMPAGIILSYGGTSAPAGWLIADGSAVSRNTYVDLFAVIGTTYGSGDGSTTFNLPNLKGKFPVGFNSAETEFNALGKAGGAKSVTPTVSGSNAADAAQTMVANGSSKGVAINAHTHTWSGAVSAVATIPPYLTINYIIKF